MPDPRYLLLSLPILILSFTVHEFAHAWVALRQGDDTAYMLGRVTLNPAAHIDPVGTLLLPMIAILTGAPLLGWAKPVPTTPRKYHDYKRGDILVSIAGVVANFGMAIAFSLLSVAMIWAYRLAPGAEGVWDTLLQMFDIGVRLNILLILFNLIPIPPLDGSRVLVHFLSPKAALSYREMSRYGMAVLMLLVFMGGFRFLVPLTDGIYSVFRGMQEVLV